MNAEVKPTLVDSDYTRRFSGLDRLYGVGPAQRIKQAHVAVIGIGGVGSWAAEALARSGVGIITLVDMDHISESNINRQIHALTPTIGMSKVQSMAQRISEINPQCVCHVVDDFVTANNWPQLLPPNVNAVIDACDNMQAKVTMAAWFRTNKQANAHVSKNGTTNNTSNNNTNNNTNTTTNTSPQDTAIQSNQAAEATDATIAYITVGAAGGKRLAQAVEIEDLSACTHDPLLSQLRYQLRKNHGAPKEGKSIGISCVFSREAVKPPDISCNPSTSTTDSTLNCHGYGSLVTVTATFGLAAAGWVLNKICDK